MGFRLRLISASFGIGIDFAVVVVVIVEPDEGLLTVCLGMTLELLVMANPIISGGSFKPGMLLWSFAITPDPALIMEAADVWINELINSKRLLSMSVRFSTFGLSSFPFSFGVKLSLPSRIIKSSFARVVKSRAPPVS